MPALMIMQNYIQLKVCANLFTRWSSRNGIIIGRILFTTAGSLVSVLQYTHQTMHMKVSK